LLSEVERIVLKSIGDAITKDKDAAIDIMLSVVNTGGFDEDTGLEFAGILAFSEGVFNTLLWRISPSVEFFCDTFKTKAASSRYHREFLEVFGWSK